MCKSVLIFLTLFINCAMGQPVNWDTTLTIHKIPVTIKTKQLKDNKVLLVTQSKFKNTIVDTLEADGLLNLELTDLNNDHYSGIMATYIGNNPTYFLYLFEPSEEKFIRLEGYDKFPDAVQLKEHPFFYYSYHRAGCADFNWMSDLFKIEKFKVVHIG